MLWLDVTSPKSMITRSNSQNVDLFLGTEPWSSRSRYRLERYRLQWIVHEASVVSPLVKPKNKLLSKKINEKILLAKQTKQTFQDEPSETDGCPGAVSHIDLTGDHNLDKSSQKMQKRRTSWLLSAWMKEKRTKVGLWFGTKQWLMVASARLSVLLQVSGERLHEQKKKMTQCHPWLRSLLVLAGFSQGESTRLG